MASIHWGRAMDFRDYIILKASDYIVRDVYRGPQETPHNIEEIVAALNKVMRYLVEEYYGQGYDVIIARGQNFDSVKRSLPELRWGKHTTHSLTEFAGSVRK